jgi:transcriptional regulator with PAS, ATPase and Fis domain
LFKAKKAAKVASTVLLEGESGTGKEIIARAIHRESGRPGAFVPVNCGAIPKELIESELFGYEEGAFTGAKRGGMKGKFELADQGTLFLDEIGEMPLEMQVRLLRVLDDKTITRVGGSKPQAVDVRVIAATNRNLKEEIRAGRFREDLYFRLNVVNITLPPLRARKTDIPLLANYFVRLFCKQFQREEVLIPEETMALLCRYDWPGNVRELRNVIESALIFTEGKILTPESLPAYLREHLPISRERKKGKLREYEEEIVWETLKMYEGNISRAARALGISRNTLYRKIGKLPKS